MWSKTQEGTHVKMVTCKCNRYLGSVIAIATPLAGAGVAVPLRVPVEWVWPSVPALPGASLRLRQQDLPQHVLHGTGSTPCFVLCIWWYCVEKLQFINAILILLSNYFYLAPARKAAAPGASGRACTGSTTARAARRPPRGPGITCTENNIYTEIV